MKTNPLNFGVSSLNPIERITKGLPVITTDHSAIHEKIGFCLTNKMDITSAKVGALSIRPPGDVAATVTINMTNALADLTYTAKETGYAGNDIAVTHVDPAGANKTLAVSVSGTDITVSLATNGGSAITSTAAQVKAAVNAHATASGLVTCEDEGAGTGVVNAVVKTNLAAGTDASYVHLKPLSFIVTAGPVYVSLLEDATFTGNTATLTPINQHRGGVVPDSKIPCSGTADATVVNGASALTLATIVLPGNTIAGRIGSAFNSDREWPLAPGKNYLVAITNATSPGATITVGYDIFWYEESLL